MAKRQEIELEQALLTEEFEDFVAAVGDPQKAIQFQDEGANLGAVGTADVVNFVGAGVTATRIGNSVTVTVTSGVSAFTGLSDVPASYAGAGLKSVRVNAGATALEFFTPAGGGDALVANPLSQFAATTSLQLKGVINDETGSGALVFANSPALVTPTGIVPSDLVGFNAAALAAAPAETTSTLGATINGAAAAVPNDTDLVTTVAASVIKKITWTNVKAFLKTYFDTLYQVTGSYQASDADLTAIAALNSATANVIASDGAGWIAKTYAQLKTAMSFVKGDVGLGAVDNTSDAGKPVSTAQQTALDLKANLASPTFTGTVVVPDASWSLAKLANMATASVFYRKTAGTGSPEVQTLATLKVDLGLVGNNNGDQTTIVGIAGTMAQFDTAVSDGNIVYQSQALGTPLSGTLTNCTGLPTAGIVDDAVTFPKFQNITSQRFLGRTTAGSGDVEELRADVDLQFVGSILQIVAFTGDVTKPAGGTALTIGAGTVTEAMQVLADNTTQNFTTARHGYVPKGTNIGSFLKDDGTWAAPVAGASDTNRNLYVTTADVNIPANYSIYYPDEYEVGSGFVTDLAAAAIMEIG